VKNVIADKKNIITIIRILVDLLRQDDWAGYDPYDALTSPLLKRTQSKWPLIVVTQILRYSPVNMRILLKIQRGHNPKALGLFVRAIVRSQNTANSEDYTADIRRLLELIRLTMIRTEEDESVGWGYNFAWQSRVFFREEYAPNIQSTIVIAHALCDIIERGLLGDAERESLTDLCLSANRYLINHLLVYEDDKTAMLDYFPGANARVLNIQAQGAWSLLRANRISGDHRFASLAGKLITFVLNHQDQDGSWPYGLADSQGFIDNFHTGFILESLYEAMKLNPKCGDENKLRLGYRFYLDHFFCKNGAVKYYHDRTYPIDGHAIAQSIITLSKLRSYDSRSAPLLDGVLKWTLANFRSCQGSFYYQKWPLFTNKIPYLRWVQAWMLYALVILLELEGKETDRCAE